MPAADAGYPPYERQWRVTGAYADGTAMDPRVFTTDDPKVAQNALAAQQAVAPGASLEYWSGTRWMPYLVS